MAVASPALRAVLACPRDVASASRTLSALRATERGASPKV